MNAAGAATVPEVIERLRLIEAGAARSNGVACFARLYRQVTEGVKAKLGEQTFADSRFLERLDISFAGLFFTALEAYEHEPASAPSAWQPLFTQQSSRGIAPLQFAFAGMNAHINRDLPVALVSTCRELGLDLSEGTPQHADFERINLLLRQIEQKLKASYLSGWLAEADRLLHRFHRIDDVLAMWDVERAREAAWTNGQALWAVRDQPALSAEFLLALDRMVGLASRGLLVPADSLLQKLGRKLLGSL